MRNLPPHPATRRRNGLATLLLAAAAASCSAPIQLPVPSLPLPSRVPEPPVAADSGTTIVVAPGVVQHSLFRGSGPWAIHLLDVDRTKCWMPAALKRDTAAIGRERTSELLARVKTVGDTVAAVNADFFMFTPPGVPTNAHVDEGVVITGPGTRPVFAVDSTGRVTLGRLRVSGTAVARGASFPITEWNRVPVTRLGVFDEKWGVHVDTLAGRLHVAVSREGRVLGTFTGTARAGIPRGGWVLTTGRNAPAAMQRWLRSLRPGNIVRVTPRLTPHPHDAVGGFPLIVVDSARAPALDSSYTRGLAQARHPRTAVGLADGGRRLFLVVVDGRQPGYSVGMTLPELADLMMELGAHDALNLDGGGSSTMAVRTSDAEPRVVNRPSDAGGERPVGNALAIVKGCR